jgi:glutamine phosphoribosylpyrophosphate amidotransferase
MCGIAAFCSGRKPISAQRLKHTMDSLRHRGPDARGAWLSPNRRVGLGHTRLSIIDLETGDQLITNENGRIHIVANGEFYDFERQRSELTDQGHRSTRAMGPPVFLSILYRIPDVRPHAVRWRLSSASRLLSHRDDKWIRTSCYWDFNYSRADDLAASTRPERFLYRRV